MLPLRIINSKLFRALTFTAAFFLMQLAAYGQFFTLTQGKTKTIPFVMARNLVIIKVNINNSGPYNFILDTGVGFMLITDPKLVDSVNVIPTRTVTIAGLGENEPVEAYLTSQLKVDIEGLQGYNINAAILKTDVLGLSAYSGMPIHGLLGYEFFNRLAVKISFSDTTIQVAQPKDMRFYKRGVKLPIKIEDRKPYLNTKVVFANGTEKQSKLIIDLGAGHFLSMENLKNKDQLQQKAISVNLGLTVTGFMNGTISRIKELHLGKYKMKNVITSFPDFDKYLQSLSVNRDGNLGIAMLKKFDVIFNYADSLLYLRPGREFNKKDEHDMSGLVYYADFKEDRQHIIIHKVEEGSAGQEAGLLPNDEIVSINFKPVSPLSIQQIDNLFKSADGRSYMLGIFRDGAFINVLITLKRRI